MLNDDFKQCKDKSQTNLKNYFTEDNMTYYSCEDYRYKNNIKCFSILPLQNITLTFIQAQMKDNILIIFMLTHSPLPKDFTLKTLINVYTSGRLRNLQNSEKEVILTIDNDSNGSKNQIVCFKSNEEIKNENGNDEKINIQIKDINFDNENTITNVVTENNNCQLNFDKNSELIDTGKVESLINENKVTDFSKNLNDNNANYEVINLNVNDIDVEKNVIYINNSKCNKSRVIPLSSVIKNLYNAYLIDREYSDIGLLNNTALLIKSDDKRITSDTIKSLFRRLKKQSGIERIHPHLLRHTFATSYLIQGGNLEQLRIILGHSDYNVTRHYLHLAASNKLLNYDYYKLDENIIH